MPDPAVVLDSFEGMVQSIISTEPDVLKRESRLLELYWSYIGTGKYKDIISGLTTAIYSHVRPELLLEDLITHKEVSDSLIILLFYKDLASFQDEEVEKILRLFRAHRYAIFELISDNQLVLSDQEELLTELAISIDQIN
ncbi:MAG: hypothetical protein WCT08_05430 [Patescibacteria group bacterium]|jgi:hypothetical protein